ncbi:hypothetical protein EVAR_56259_1 [Eumeta japonica]|uniref:Uncharacterized protein n=1 Tax=Eumeta variegata TaxID=151549 RepID=A0A4C1XFN0_EUMVA|nr:hypothetical protein EVAR_56259_1 [Eumeta japonica]
MFSIVEIDIAHAKPKEIRGLRCILATTAGLSLSAAYGDQKNDDISIEEKLPSPGNCHSRSLEGRKKHSSSSTSSDNLQSRAGNRTTAPRRRQSTASPRRDQWKARALRPPLFEERARAVRRPLEKISTSREPFRRIVGRFEQLNVIKHPGAAPPLAAGRAKPAGTFDSGRPAPSTRRLLSARFSDAPRSLPTRTVTIK